MGDTKLQLPTGSLVNNKWSANTCHGAHAYWCAWRGRLSKLSGSALARVVNMTYWEGRPIARDASVQSDTTEPYGMALGYAPTTGGLEVGAEVNG